MLFPLLTYISTQTASNVASVEFTSGIDTTYKTYQFVVSLDRVTSDGTKIGVMLSTNGGSSYGVGKVTTLFRAYHTPSSGATSLAYYPDYDLSGASTAVQYLMANLGNDNSTECGRCIYTLIDPSSTVMNTNFFSIGSIMNNDSESEEVWFMSGDSAASAAVDAVKFQTSAGNFYGDIKLYGVGE